jgi:hypothetical protein
MGSAVVPASSRAQQAVASGVMPELRADVIAGDRPALHVGAGVQVPVGYYVRVGIIGAAGVGEGAGRHRSGRVDLIARFLLDPFRQTRYGLSLGGGVTLRADQGDRVRPALLMVADVEGRRATPGWVPAVQVGLGGGVRVGVALRRGVPGAR